MHKITSIDKTSCISLDFGLIRLVRRGDNPNKKTRMYIPYTPCLNNLSSYNSSCPQSDINKNVGNNYCITEIVYSSNEQDNVIIQ